MKKQIRIDIIWSNQILMSYFKCSNGQIIFQKSFLNDIDVKFCNLKLQKVSDRDQQIKELTQKLKADGKDAPYFILKKKFKFCNVKFISWRQKDLKRFSSVKKRLRWWNSFCEIRNRPADDHEHLEQIHELMDKVKNLEIERDQARELVRASKMVDLQNKKK